MTAKHAAGLALGLLVAVTIVYFVFFRETQPRPPVANPPDQPETTTARPAPRRPNRPAPPPAKPVVTPDSAPAPAAAARETGRLRLMAANLSSGSRQNYDGGHGIRIMRGAKPDVVMIQEFNYRTGRAGDLQAMADQVMGAPAHYYREASAVIPNGVISRYPIVAAGEWNDPAVDNRDFAWARIDIPGPIDLWVVSIHLLTTKSTERNQQAQTLVAHIQRAVPTAAYLAIGGDFNTGTKNEACYRTFAQVADVTGPYPADQAGNSNTNNTRDRAYDAILVDADLDRYAAPVVIGSQSFPNGLVLDPRRFTPISLLAPASAADANTTSMQHMAVLRDFRLTDR